MTKQSTLKVTGMKCAGCVANVEKALKSVSGVSNTAVDLKAGKVVVDYDPGKTSEKDLAGAVKKAGYGVG
jgi:copper ion binding protein